MKIKTVTVVGANGTMGINVSGIFANLASADYSMLANCVKE